MPGGSSGGWISARTAGVGVKALHRRPAVNLKPPPNPQTLMFSRCMTVDPEIHSGTPVFAGTRVPIKTLFDHLEAGDSLEVFLDDFPTVSRELAVAVLEEARTALVPDAHPA